VSSIGLAAGYLGGVRVDADAVWTGRGGWAGLFIWLRAGTRAKPNVVKAGSFAEGRGGFWGGG